MDNFELDVEKQMVENKKGLYTPGNHCNKLYRYFLGNKVKIIHGLETTVAELDALPYSERQDIRQKFMNLYENAPLYLTLDSGKLVIAHAGIKAEWIGTSHKGIKSFVLYGDTTGRTLF